MAIKTIKQAAAAIEALDAKIDALEDELALAKTHNHPKPPAPSKPDLSKVEAGIKANHDTFLEAFEKAAARIVALEERPAVLPDVDTLIKILGAKVMFRMR